MERLGKPATSTEDGVERAGSERMKSLVACFSLSEGACFFSSFALSVSLGPSFKLVPWDGDIFMATLMAPDQFGPIVDLDYMTKGFAQFQWIKIEAQLLRLPPSTVKPMNSGSKFGVFEKS